jgi:hypothetical protein
VRTATRRKPCLYVPEGFSAAKYGYKPEHEDGLRWILSTIHFYRVAVLDKDKQDAPVYLSAKLLEKMVGHALPAIRDEGVRLGLLTCDYKCVNSTRGIPSKCYGYQLGPALAGVKFTKWKGDGAVYLNRLKRFKAEWTSTRDLDALGKYLRRWLLKVRVAKSAKDALAEMPEAKRELATHQIDLIKDGMIRTTYCDYGRFHSNFTRLCSEVRGHLEVDGERLVEIDITSSQVLFLAKVLGPDAAELVADLEAGRVYERFQAHCGYATRGEAKRAFFHSIYGGIRQTKTFSELWPQAGEALKQLKRDHDYKWVPQEMQRRESDLILRTVVDTLRREHPEVPVVTVHDSIATTARYVDLVRSLLLEAFEAAEFPCLPILRAK